MNHNGLIHLFVKFLNILFSWLLSSSTKNKKERKSNKKILTLRKKSPPDKSSTLCEPGNILSGTPSLYHWIVGVGDPSALQFSVAGSCLGIIEFVGCSMILGGCVAVNIFLRIGLDNYIK